MHHTAPGREPARRDDARHVPSTTRRPNRSHATRQFGRHGIDNRTMPTSEQLDRLPEQLRFQARLNRQSGDAEIGIEATGRFAIISAMVIALCLIGVAAIVLSMG